MTSRTIVCALVMAGSAFGARPAGAEPKFLSKQYTRCTSCHISPTGGGLLSSYGRSLSGQELSLTGRRAPAGDPSSRIATGEEAFLWGAFGKGLGPVQLGVELRPSHVRTLVNDQTFTRDIVMNADLVGAVQGRGWTFYGQVGREPTSPGWKIDSYEHWGGYQAENGFGVRGGRFTPAYGVRFADHTAFNRTALGFTQYDQVYGVEVSRTTDRVLLQVALAPGLAESFGESSTPTSFNGVGRMQIDLGPSTALVVSGLYRDESDERGREGSGGAAIGFGLTSRMTVWTQADLYGRDGTGKTGVVFINETAVEALRGVWLAVSPQWRSDDGLRSETMRWAFTATVLPRTHFNFNLSFYHDKPKNSVPAKTWLFQMHFYL